MPMVVTFEANIFQRQSLLGPEPSRQPKVQRQKRHWRRGRRPRRQSLWHQPCVCLHQLASRRHAGAGWAGERVVGQVDLHREADQRHRRPEAETSKKAGKASGTGKFEADNPPDCFWNSENYLYFWAAAPQSAYSLKVKELKKAYVRELEFWWF